MRLYTATTILLLTTLSIGYAQSPGGVSGGGANELWFDAAQLTLNNGDLVATWTDMSGNGNNAVPTKYIWRPTYNTGQINGRPSVVFDGVNDQAMTGSIAALETNTITHFTVFDGSPANHIGWVFGGNYTTNSQFVTVYRSNATIYNWIRPSAAAVATTHTNNSAYQIINGIWDGGAGTVSSYKDGGDFQTNSSVSAAPTGSNYYRIGANPSGPGNYYFNGGIAEIITYSKVLNTAERQIIENYLSAKYGIAVVSDMYAYQATHSYDVIGIGQEADGNNLSAKGVSPLGFLIGSLSNGEYLFAGHDNAGYSPNTTDVPVGESRYNQVWRADVTGTPGLFTVTMDVSVHSLGAASGYKLLVDADGVFAAGATSYPGVYAGGTVTFSNVSLSTGSYFTLSNGSSVVLSTGATTDWHTASTWDCTCIPSAGMMVTIQGAHTVDINGQNATSESLTVNGVLTFSGTDTLSVLADLTNTGTFTSGSGTVNLNGTSLQTLSGTLALNNLVVDNSAGVTNTGTLSIASGGFLDVQSGSLTTGDNLTFLSNSTGTGALANPTSGSITGDVTVQRYLAETSPTYYLGNSWYLLSPMVIGGDLEDWNQEFEMQGFPGTEWPVTNSSVFYFDQNNITTVWDEGYTVPGNSTDIMDNQVGYEIWVGDDSYASGTRVIDITGTLALGSVAIPAPHVDKLPGTADDGWTLMANPYASPVRFGNIQKTGAYDNAYRRKYNGSSVLINVYFVIGVGEAFWVHSDPGGATITFDPTDVNSTNIDRYNEIVINANPDPILNIKLNYDGNEFDETMLGFSESAIDSRERGVDAYKLDNRYLSKPNISTMIGEDDFHKNMLNMNTESIIPIRIYRGEFEGKLEKYVLEIENVEDILKHNKKLILEDREENTFIALKSNVSIPFEMMDNVKEPRFFLHVKSPLDIATENVSCTSANDASITVKSGKSGLLRYVWFENGQNVIRESINSDGVDEIENLASGNYTVWVHPVDDEDDLVISEIEITEPSKVSSNFQMSSTEILAENISDDNIMEVNVDERIKFTNMSFGANKYLWEFGDGISSVSISPEHIYFNEGLYNVTLTASNGVCTEVSNQYIQVSSPLGINETNLLNDFNVIVKENEILVSLNNTKILTTVSFDVYNSVGQLIYTKDVKANVNHQEKIRLDNAQGIYLIVVRDGDNTKTKKIVLSKK